MYKINHSNLLIISCILSILPLCSAQATQSNVEIITHAKLTEVATTINLKNSSQSLRKMNKQLVQEKKSTVLLQKLGCLTAKSLKAPIADCAALKPLSIDYPTPPSSLTSILNKLLKNNVFEGYNIKSKNLITSEKSGKNIIVYGHSSLRHAKQLITLLTINDVDFTSKLIPKESAFNIRKNWKDIKSGEELSSIRTDKEYDIQFTFPDQTQLKSFMPLINKFAKKDTDHQKGLIIDAWWQPFYRVFYPQKNFIAIKRISLQSDGFIGSTLVLTPNLNKALSDIKTALAGAKGNISVSSEDVWVNPAFYRYLNGGFK